MILNLRMEHHGLVISFQKENISDPMLIENNQVTKKIKFLIFHKQEIREMILNYACFEKLCM